MFEIIAENSLLRMLLLALVFAAVAVAGYLIAQSFVAREQTRRRLVHDGPRVAPEAQVRGSLRAEQAESTWLNLVNSIEKSGLSLGDTKASGQRQLLAAAGYSAPYAQRVYTLVRLVLVIGLPLLVLALFWFSGSTPGMFKL